jgi:hypothetical protein
VGYFLVHITWNTEHVAVKVETKHFPKSTQNNISHLVELERKTLEAESVKNEDGEKHVQQ